jgi:hypothetical protein
MSEGRPQRFDTQWLDDPRDGRIRPWKLAEVVRVKEFRASVDSPDLRPIPEPGPDLPADPQEGIRENDPWWKEWLLSKGWPLDLQSESVTHQRPMERIRRIVVGAVSRARDDGGTWRVGGDPGAALLARGIRPRRDHARNAAPDIR